jgi:hypothetical protein
MLQSLSLLEYPLHQKSLTNFQAIENFEKVASSSVNNNLMKVAASALKTP